MTTERFPAIVTRLAEDATPRGRIFVKCIELTGDDVELPDPVEPVHQWGWFTVPDIGEEVEVEVVTQDGTGEEVDGQAFLEAPELRWTGRRFGSAEGEAPRPPNEIFTSKNFGKRRGFATPTGHFLMFDDTSGEEEIHVSWTRADGALSTMVFDKQGSIALTNRTGSMVVLDAQNNRVLVVDENGNTISMTSSGVDVVTVSGGVVNVDSGGGTVNILGGTVNVGDGADSPIARFIELQQWADTHVHLTAFGPSSPPAAAGTPLPPAVGSQTGKVAP